jgi:hypothetical protein
MRVKKLLLPLLFAALAAATPAAAQTDERKFEFFGGYSYLRADTDEVDEPFTDFKNIMDGFNVAATGYVSKRVGITGDFSAHFHSITNDSVVGEFTAKTRTYNFTAGPQVRFPGHGRVTPFLHALAGVAHNRLTIDAPPPIQFDPTNSLGLTDFTLMLGGGLDVRLGERVSLRLVQFDYNPVFIRERPEVGIESTRLDNFRVSVGLVFR